MAAASLSLNGCTEIENLLAFCKIPKERVRIEESGHASSTKVPSLTLSTGQTVHGVRTVASYLSALSRQTLLGNSALEHAQVDQWLEYWQLQLEKYLNDTTQVCGALKDLNKFMSKRVYLVGHELTLADIMLYYALHPVMLELTVHGKEQLINLSRWFNQVQCYPGVRQYLPEVSFLRNTLYG
ncbi:unnamed protein product [Porites lobata]|uniref:GST C-terminal domain-containing protein n=1 Tax=Porites lobata TaxID=104759 RepID=A0ABN8QDK4_9CNID|nr:unnamed protein product [Porites lobata]